MATIPLVALPATTLLVIVTTVDRAHVDPVAAVPDGLVPRDIGADPVALDQDALAPAQVDPVQDVARDHVSGRIGRPADRRIASTA